MINNLIKLLKIIIRKFLSLPDIYKAFKQRASIDGKTIRLNLGVGPYPIGKGTHAIMDSYGKGWIYIDKYIKQPGTYNYDVQDLPYAANSVDTILASHILEHIPFLEIPKVLNHWKKILKDKGQIYLNVPDMEWMCQRFIDLTKADRQKSKKFKSEYFHKSCDYYDSKHCFLSAIYGSQVHLGEFHYGGFTKESLKELMQQIGFKNLKIISQVEMHDVGCLIVTATKN